MRTNHVLIKFVLGLAMLCVCAGAGRAGDYTIAGNLVVESNALFNAVTITQNMDASSITLDGLTVASFSNFVQKTDSEMQINRLVNRYWKGNIIKNGSFESHDETAFTGVDSWTAGSGSGPYSSRGVGTNTYLYDSSSMRIEVLALGGQANCHGYGAIQKIDYPLQDAVSVSAWFYTTNENITAMIRTTRMYDDLSYYGIPTADSATWLLLPQGEWTCLELMAPETTQTVNRLQIRVGLMSSSLNVGDVLFVDGVAVSPGTMGASGDSVDYIPSDKVTFGQGDQYIKFNNADGSVVIRSGGSVWTNAAMITGDQLASASVSSDKLATNAVYSGNIADASIVLNDLDLTSVDSRYVNAGGDTLSGDYVFSGGNSANTFIVTNRQGAFEIHRYRYFGSIQNGGDYESGDSYYTYIGNGAFHEPDTAWDEFYVPNAYVDASAMVLGRNGAFYILGYNVPTVGSYTLDKRFVLNADGNVGIGTASPGAKLDVNGTVLIMPGGDIPMGDFTQGPTP